jgi:hypothetical protein
MAETTRHPLGLPAGSIRAVMATVIAALFWTILLLPESWNIPAPLFLYFLSIMVLLFFFGHGKTIAPADEKPPWGLPRGTFRVIIVLGTIGGIVAHYLLHRDHVWRRLQPNADQFVQQWPYLLVAISAGLGFGWLVGRGPWRRSAIFQDLQAWVSLLAMLGLLIETVIVLFINPNVGNDLKLNLTIWEAALTAVIAWYFGSRS